MKKLFSNLVVGTASLAALAGTSMAIVSCGSSTDNTAKYAAVLKQAVAQVVTAKRQDSAKITKVKQSFSISVSDISAQATKIIADQKLNIKTSYFKHLYIFIAFKESTTLSQKNTVTISQNSKSRPTSVTINYDNTKFNNATSQTAQPESTLLGEISIDIKQRHLLVMKKLISTIDYNLNNTAYFDTNGAKWTGPTAGATSKFVNGSDGTALANGIVKKWLTVSASPTDPTQLIGVSPNGVWYSADTGATWTSGLTTYSASSLSDFQPSGVNKAGGLSIDAAKIKWNGSTAYISLTHMSNGKQVFWASLNSGVSDLLVCRLAANGVGPAANNDLFKKDDKSVTTIAPLWLTGPSTASQKAVMTNGFHTDSKGDLFWATTNTLSDNQIQGVYSVTPATIAKVQSVKSGGNGLIAKVDSFASTAGTGIKGVVVQDMTMSPDGSQIWLLFNKGLATHISVKNGLLVKTTVDIGLQGTTGNSADSITGVASNKGLYYIASTVGGHKGKIESIGFVGNNNKDKAITNLKGEDLKVGAWSYGYMGDSTGKNAYELLSTGNKGQTFIINADNTSGELTPATIGDFSGFLPYGTIANPDNGTNVNQGLVVQPLAGLDGSGNVKFGDSAYFLPSDHSSMNQLNGYKNTGSLTAVSGNYTTLAAGNEIYNINDVSVAPQSIFAGDATGMAVASSIDSSSVSLLKDTATTTTFTGFSPTGASSNALTGVSITYKGSSLTWSAPSKFM